MVAVIVGGGTPDVVRAVVGVRVAGLAGGGAGLVARGVVAVLVAGAVLAGGTPLVGRVLVADGLPGCGDGVPVVLGGWPLAGLAGGTTLLVFPAGPGAGLPDPGPWSASTVPAIASTAAAPRAAAARRIFRRRPASPTTLVASLCPLLAPPAPDGNSREAARSLSWLRPCSSQNGP